MTSTVATADIRRARRAYAVVALIVPIVIAAIGAGLALLWLPQLPDPVAIHWRGDIPDGFMPAAAAPLVVGGFGLLLPLVFGVIGLAASRHGQWGPTLRFLGAVSLGATVLVVVAMVLSFAVQRGLTDAHDAASVALPLGIAAAAGLVAGLIGWFAQPRVDAVHREPGAAAAVPVAAGERVAWLRTTTMAAGAVIALVGAVVLIAVVALVFALVGIAVWWLLAIIALVVLLVALSTMVFRVRVDARGLRAASMLGFPRVRIPLDDIASVQVAHITPFAEFGGWGFRVTPDGQVGIVMRTGDGIRVTRTNGRTFSVTVADAVTGAGLLSALVAERRAHSADA